MPCVDAMTTNPMQCGAQTRDGDPCKAAAMENGRCRMHGGTNPGRPITTGRYSVAHRRTLAEKMQRFLEDPQPADLSAELALMRALLDEYLGRFAGDVLMAPQEIEQAMGMVESISQLVERISRILNTTALTTAEVQLLQASLGDLVMKYVDPAKRLAFLDELTATLSGGRGGPGARLTIDHLA